MVKLKTGTNLLLEPWHLEDIPFHFQQVTNLPSSVLSALEALCSAMVEPWYQWLLHSVNIAISFWNPPIQLLYSCFLVL
jgi:hypothetical protein